MTNKRHSVVQFQNGAYEVCFRRLPPGFPLVPQDFKHYRLPFRIVLEISQSAFCYV